MELTKLKRINNTHELPGFVDGTPGYNGPEDVRFKVPTSVATMKSGELGAVQNYSNIFNITGTDKEKQMIGGVSGVQSPLDIKYTRSSDKTNDPITMEQVAGAIPATIAFGSDLYNSGRYNRTADELIAQGGTSQSQIGGIGYTVENGVNMSDFNKEINRDVTNGTLKTTASGAAAGAAIGSIIPGLGTVAGGLIGGAAGLIGGLIGGSSKKKKALEQARLANIQANINNNFKRSGAATARLQLDALQRSGDTQSQIRGYSKGKDLLESGGWGKVSSGEAITDGENVIGQVPGKPDFKDDYVMYVGKKGIISNHQTIPGIRNSQYAIKTNDVAGALLLDEIARAKKGSGYKHGKLPCFKEGYLGNLIPSGLGMVASVGQYLDASGQDIRSPQIYSANPYEQSALYDLAGLRINQYPIINQINQATRTADNAIRTSGGLSGYQRSVLRSSNLRNTQKSISDALIGVQAQNNQYRAQLANAKMQLGSQQAQRRQQANMFNEEMLAKAHAARQQGMQMGIYNFLNQLQGYYANEFKRRQFNDTMDLYRQQQDLDKAQFNSWINQYNKPKATATVRAPLGTTTIKKLGGLQNPYASRMYIDDLLKRVAAFKPTLRR